MFAVEPDTARCLRWLEEATAFAVRLYWDLFVSIPVTIFSFMFAGMAVFIGFLDLAQHPQHFWSDVPLIGFSVAFLVFARLRTFVWALLACSVGWVVIVALLLLPFVGPDYLAGTMTAKILLGAVDFLPPLLAALCIDRARHSKI